MGSPDLRTAVVQFCQAWGESVVVRSLDLLDVVERRREETRTNIAAIEGHLASATLIGPPTMAAETSGSGTGGAESQDAQAQEVLPGRGSGASLPSVSAVRAVDADQEELWEWWSSKKKRTTKKMSTLK